MLCVWWNFEGAIHWEFVPYERAVYADLYSKQLEQIHEILRPIYPVLINQQDNVRPHTVRTTMTKIQELGGIELLPQPATLILRFQIIICFNPRPISCVEVISKTLKLWKWVSPNSSH